MMAVQIQLRRDTGANWTSANPVLATGEMGLETDTRRYKIGDGATAWNSLAYSVLDGFTPGRRYVYSTTTADADPGAGNVRFDNATFASITTLFFDNTDAAGGTVTAWLDSLDDSSDPSYKGALLLQKADNPHIYREFIISGSVVDGTGYRKVAVTPLAQAGSLSDNDPLVVTFYRAGSASVDTARLLPAGGASGQVLGKSSGTDYAVSWVDQKRPPAPLPTMSNNTSDATNDIDITTGEALDSTRAIIIACPAMTKRLDANWAAGTSNGGRYSGAAIANTTYHCYAVAKAAGADPDYYFDPSADPATALSHLQAETGGAAYAYVRRIGAIVRESAAIVAFKQDGDLFIRAPSGQTAVDPGTTAQTVTLPVPTGIRVCAILSVNLALSSSGAENYALLVSDLAIADSAPSTSLNDLIMATLATSGVYRMTGNASAMTNTSGQIRARLSVSVSGLVQNITVRGWIDRRE